MLMVCVSNTMCMILAGAGRRLQTCRGLAAKLFDSTLRTIFRILMTLSLTEGCRRAETAYYSRYILFWFVFFHSDAAQQQQ